MRATRAAARTYRYLILNRLARSALYAHRAAWIHRPLDHERMAAAAATLLGEHDFSAFRSSECQAKSPIRRLERLSVERRGDWVIIEATANAFLHHMMRNIAGLLIARRPRAMPRRRGPARCWPGATARAAPPPRRRRACTSGGALPGRLRPARPPPQEVPSADRL